MKKRFKNIILLLVAALCLGMIVPAGSAFAAGKTAYLPAKFTYKGDTNIYVKYVWNAQGGLEKQILGVSGEGDSQEFTTENTYYPSGKVESQSRFTDGKRFETVFFTKAGKLKKKILGTDDSAVRTVTTYKYNGRGYLHVEKLTSTISNGETQSMRIVHKYKYHKNGKPSNDTSWVQGRKNGKWQKHGMKTVKLINGKGYATELRTYVWSRKKNRYVRKETEKCRYTYNKQGLPTRVVIKSKGHTNKVLIRYSKIKATKIEYRRALNDRMQLAY